MLNTRDADIVSGTLAQRVGLFNILNMTREGQIKCAEAGLLLNLVSISRDVVCNYSEYWEGLSACVCVCV